MMFLFEIRNPEQELGIRNQELGIRKVALGNGMTIFKGLESKPNFNLVKATSFDCGIVTFHYEPKQN